MTIPNPRPEIFVPGKVIQVRSRTDPMIVKLVFISVEEHVQHVGEMLAWLFPDATELQMAGARLHDVGKKSGSFVTLERVKPGDRHGVLLEDFYACGADGRRLTPGDAAVWYREKFLGISDGKLSRASNHVRLWPASDGSDIRMDLDPPFGNHAAEVTEEDVQRYRAGALDLEADREGREYVLQLVRLHHSFQPDRIVSACAQHGEGIVRDLYRLIVADHGGSRWAEYVIQQLEDGAENPEREDFFGDAKVTVAGEPQAQGDEDGLKLGMVRLRRERLVGETGEPSEMRLVVRYYADVASWDLRELREGLAEGGSQTSRKDVRRSRPGGRGGP